MTSVGEEPPQKRKHDPETQSILNALRKAKRQKERLEGKDAEKHRNRTTLTNEPWAFVTARNKKAGQVRLSPVERVPCPLCGVMTLPSSRFHLRTQGTVFLAGNMVKLHQQTRERDAASFRKSQEVPRTSLAPFPSRTTSMTLSGAAPARF